MISHVAEQTGPRTYFAHFACGLITPQTLSLSRRSDWTLASWRRPNLFNSANLFPSAALFCTDHYYLWGSHETTLLSLGCYYSSRSLLTRMILHLASKNRVMQICRLTNMFFRCCDSFISGKISPNFGDVSLPLSIKAIAFTTFRTCLTHRNSWSCLTSSL